LNPRLIVNADDYGLTSGVSEGIRYAHLSGIVSSTSAMMNHPASQSDLPKARSRCPKLGLGVHLVLTIGTPVLPTEKVPTLVDASGAFLKHDVLSKRLDQINPDEALAEWQAQVQQFVRVTGRNPDHLDSHHHCSYFSPALFERMLMLAAEIGCPIRCPYGNEAISAAGYLPGGHVETDFAAVQALLAKYKPKTTQVFCGDFYGETATMTHLTEVLAKLAADTSGQTLELMCHPTVLDNKLRSVSSYTHQRAVELQILTDPHARALLKENNIELINFGDL